MSKQTIANKKSVTSLILMLMLIVILIIICGVAYAKYVTRADGTATAKIAKIICYMDVKSSSEDNSGNVITPADKTQINPYCILTVKDYNGELANPSEVTETDVTYTITVSPKKENGVPTFTMPEYNWYEIESPDATTGTKVAMSPAGVTGKFTHSQAKNKYYKIVFLNSGEQDITRYVEFNLQAVQDRPE